MHHPPVKLAHPDTHVCALCETDITGFAFTFAHYDDDGALVGVAFTDGRKKVLHRCGVDFDLPPRPKMG